MLSLIALCILWVSIAQQIVILDIPFQNSTKVMYTQGKVRPQFNYTQYPWYNCKVNQLFTLNQTHKQSVDNPPFYISLLGVREQVHIVIDSSVDYIHPHANTTVCEKDCIIEITQTCPSTTTFFRNFDGLDVHLSTLSQTISFIVKCNSDQIFNTFQWGLIILVIVSIIFLIIMSWHSTSWAFYGLGLQINFISVFVIQLLFLTTIILLTILRDQVVDVVKYSLDVIAYILIFLSLSLCFVQILFLCPCRGLKMRHVKIRQTKIRLLDFIGLFGGLCFATGSYFVAEYIQNWIYNTFISTCIIFAIIKVVKFTSLRIAIIAFILNLIIQLIFILVTQISQRTYNNEVFDLFFNPLFIAIPTINLVQEARCSWFFFTAFAFPGMVVSYIYRFDKSRQQLVYTYIFIGGYIFGSLTWAIGEVITPVTVPYGTVSQPIIFAVLMLFACRRNEVKALWYGQFFDQEYKDARDNSRQIQQIIQRQETHLSFRQFMFSGLKIVRDPSWIINEKTQEIQLPVMQQSLQ